MRPSARLAVIAFIATPALLIPTVSPVVAAAAPNKKQIVNEALAAIGEPPVTTPDADGVVTVAGVSFSGEAASVATSAAGSAKVLTVLNYGDAEARFALSLPEGASVHDVGDGLLAVMQITPDSGQVLAVIDKPWAVDADGKSLPTSYRLEGSTLVQEVDVTGASFPVVADPSVSSGYSWVYGPLAVVKYSKSDVTAVVQYNLDRVNRYLGMLSCLLVPNLFAAGFCALIADDILSSIGGMFRSAYKASPNRCTQVEYRVLSPSIPVFWHSYDC